MANVKLKSGKKTKGKKWKKGQSSSSNPETKKHRQAAKGRFFSQNTGPSSLTVDALAKHDAAQDGDGDTPMSESDAQTVSARTFSTWATNWTDCTNATFNRVHRYWASNSALHKEILAVLAAVTEVIKSKGGKESETEYFAALMTSLETVEGDQSTTAVVYLLSIVMKRIPASVLKSRFSEVSKTLLNLLATHSGGEAPALLRSLIMCVALVLRVQEQAAWNSSSTMQVYQSLLAFITHPKPKVRKAAHHGVCVVLKGSTFMVQGEPPPYHPAASATAKYCIQQIEDSGGTSDAGPTLHVLGLLRDILGVFPNHSIKSCCEAILRVMTLANVLVKSVSLQALHGMFQQQPKASCLPAELNAQIITALYDYQPGDKDPQQMAAWLAVMERAHLNLARVDEKLCSSHLPRLFGACMKCMQSEKPEVNQVAARSLIVLLKECVAPMAERLEAELKAAPKNVATTVHKMFRSVEAGLSYQYHQSWGMVLKVLAVFYEVLGKRCSPVMTKSLLSMADLRDSHKFEHTAEVDFAMGQAVRQMGPHTVLAAVPLNITSDEDNYDFPRSWLLPVLRDHIRDTELGFFTSYFLPLAVKLRTKSLELAKADQIVVSKTYDALQLQIWSLLPGFCTNPTDLKQSFKGIAKILGSAISESPDLRMEVMASLRKLITGSLQHEENKAELSKFAKNFLPILFNLFTSEDLADKDSRRLAVLETIKCYMQIADVQLINGFFDKCHGKLSEGDVTAHKRHALMDLTIAMVPYLDKQCLAALYKTVTSQLQSTDKTIQKKSYRVLEEMCAGKSQACKAFVESHVGALQSTLLEALSTSAPSSKSPRLRCLKHMFSHLESEHSEFLQAVIPEAILCTKEVAERARTAAYALLVEMGRAATRWSNKPVSDSLCDYMKMVMAGLAGSPHLCSATTLALTRLVFEYKELVTSDLLSTIFSNTCLLLQSKAREVVQSALSLVKVLVRVFPDVTLAQYVKDLVSCLVSMKEDSRHHFRFKAKEVFTKLIRKFGYKMIAGMVPESHQKMLNNIRKTQERIKRRKKERDAGDSSEGEDDTFSTKSKPQSMDELLRDTDSELEEEESKSKKGGAKDVKGRKEKKGAWLKEGLVDFLDPTVSQDIITTRPEATTSSKKEKTQHGFKMSADGRLIITAGEEEQEKKRKGAGKLPGGVDDLDELMEAMDHYSKKSRKRKLGSDEDPGDTASVMTYKSGGTGIHRPLGSEAAKKKEQDYGAEYRAKKAKGDVKKKGKPDPYAYVPLQMQSLNKRKKAKMQGRFRNLVKGAKRGAAKGQKGRGKR